MLLVSLYCFVWYVEYVPLTISYHLYFLRISSSMLHHGSTGRVHSIKECCFIILYTFLTFFCYFSSKKMYFYHFHFFFLMKYRISVTEYWPVKNRNSWYEIVSGNVCVIRNCQWKCVCVTVSLGISSTMQWTWTENMCLVWMSVMEPTTGENLHRKNLV